jgi:hypothetical protein
MEPFMELSRMRRDRDNPRPPFWRLGRGKPYMTVDCCNIIRVMSKIGLDLGVAEQVLAALQQHRSRDRVELVVDIGLEWDLVAPTVDVLMDDGYVVTSVSDGEPVFALADAANPVSFAGIAQG